MMALLKYWQLILGGIGCIALGIMLMFAKADARHWKKQSGQFEQALASEKAAFAQTVANYRAAVAEAKAADEANAARALKEQQAINERSRNDLQTRLAGVGTALQRLSVNTKAAANSGGGGKPAVSSIPTPTCGTDSPTLNPIARAYDCAIQLDELIKWNKKQAAISLQGNTNDNSKPTVGTTSAQH